MFELIEAAIEEARIFVSLEPVFFLCCCSLDQTSRIRQTLRDTSGREIKHQPGITRFENGFMTLNPLTASNLWRTASTNLLKLSHRCVSIGALLSIAGYLAVSSLALAIYCHSATS